MPEILIAEIAGVLLRLFLKEARDARHAIPAELPDITTEAMQLPVSSRAELAKKLVESLDFTEENATRAAGAAGAIRRRDDVRSGRVQTTPGEQVRAEIRQMPGQ